MKISQFQVPILLLLLVLIPSQPHPIVHQIRNTKHLLQLYQTKLDLLISLARQQNITIDENYNQTEVGVGVGSGVFRLEEQVLFQVGLGSWGNGEEGGEGAEEGELDEKARFVLPWFIVTRGRIIDLRSGKDKGEVKGDIVSVEPYQITTRLDANTVRITKLGQTISSTDLKLQIQNLPGKWHHSTKFQDIFLQPQPQSLLLSTPTQTLPFIPKSQLLYIQPIHQYKLLFLTRYSYGYLNPKSLQVTGQTMFDSIVEVGLYSRQDGLLMVLFKNLTVVVFGSQGEVGRVDGVGVWGRDGLGLEYVGGYLFVYGRQHAGFNVYQVSHDYTITHYKQISLPDPFNPCSTSPYPQPQCNSPTKFTHQFFKHNNTYKLLLSNTVNSSKLYNINLPEIEPHQQKTFPWKIVLIVICIIAVVYFRSKNKTGDVEEGEDGDRRRAGKRVRREKDRVREGRENGASQDYIKELNQELKRINTAKKNT